MRVLFDFFINIARWAWSFPSNVLQPSRACYRVRDGMTASLACFNRFQIRSQRGRNTGNTLDIKTHSDVHAITPTTAAVRINMKKVRSAPTITITSPSLSSTAASRLSPRFSISSTASDVLEVAHRGLTGLYVYKNSTFQLRNSRLSCRQLRSAACRTHQRRCRKSDSILR